jgi:Holliday junction resolvase RusA-like endonuclease
VTGPLASPRPPVTITVHGTPAPQGSKRAFMGRRKDGTTYQGVIESSHDRVKSWRQAVVDEARAWRDQLGGRPPLDGPLEVAMTFWLPRPKGHYGTGRNARQLRPTAPPYPAGKPDVGKLARATEDALTGIVWHDDAQVIRYAPLAKLYVLPTVWDVGLSAPGAVITIRQLA